MEELAFPNAEPVSEEPHHRTSGSLAKPRFSSVKPFPMNNQNKEPKRMKRNLTVTNSKIKDFEPETLHKKLNKRIKKISNF